MSGICRIQIPNSTVGSGSIGCLGAEVARFSPAKILVLTDPGIVRAGIIDAVTGPLETSGLKYEVFPGVKIEPPTDVLESLANKIREEGFDLLIGVGGGSTMDTTKAVSVLAHAKLNIREYVSRPFHDKIEGRILPKILVPTTAGTGSEWSYVAVIYEDHPVRREYIVQCWEHFADRVIIDPELTRGLPQKITAETGIDALTHAIEAFTSCNANDFSDMLASTAIRMIVENIGTAFAKGGKSIEARSGMSLAAAMAMNAVVTGGIGLAHLMNQILGPKAKISHGTALGILLPAVMEFNMIANPRKFADIAAFMGENLYGLNDMEGAARAAQAVRNLVKTLDMPQTMRQFGITEVDIPGLVETTMSLTGPVIEMVNARDASAEDIRKIWLSVL